MIALRGALLAATLALVATACAPRPAGEEAPPAPSNLFGVMLPSVLEVTREGAALARELGARYLRPHAVALEGWNGRCTACELALAEGLELVLTVRSAADLPGEPPADLPAFEAALADVLARYRVALLVVENEENSALFYRGTPVEYLRELAVACGVAERFDVPCANGGLTSLGVALFVYEEYQRRGDTAAAESFAHRAFASEERVPLGGPRAADQAYLVRRLVEGYRDGPVDVVNVHWYIRDARAFEEMVQVLREVTGKPVVTNELGQRDDDPVWTREMMEAVLAIDVPVAVWFAQDGPRARGLVEPTGRLRPTGEAFRAVVAERFGAPGRPRPDRGRGKRGPGDGPGGSRAPNARVSRRGRRRRGRGGSRQGCRGG